MTHLKPSGGPGVGLFFANEDCVVWNRTGAATAVGDIVMFDIADTQTETTTTLTEGDDASPYANVIQPTTAGIGVLGAGAHTGYFFGVAMDVAADNAKCKVRVRGIVPARCDTSAILLGSTLHCTNASSALTLAATAGFKRLAIAREATGGNAGNYSVLFDGINGFGSNFAS